MTPVRVARPLTVLLAAASIALLAGCAPAPGPTPTPTPTPTASPTATPTPTPTATVQPASDPCTRLDLSITYTPTDNSAGHAHGVLTFLNSSASTCTMTGFPTVYFDNPEAAQPMGAAASNDGTAPTLVVLVPNAAATATLTITQAGFVDGCTIVTANALLVAPPITHPFSWEDDARNVPAPGIPACSDDGIGLLVVGAITH